MKNRILISNLIVAYLLIVSKPASFRLFTAGVFFIFLGEAVRLLASGSIVKSKNLTTTGLYSVVRNPLYLGTLTITFGTLMQLSSTVSPLRTINIWIVAVTAFFIIYSKTIKNEEAFLLEKYKEEFSSYLKTVPSLLPDFSKLGQAFKKENYSAEIFKKNKEYRGFFGILLIEAVIAARIFYGF